MRNNPNRYLTLDFWKSRKHYETFKRQNREMYQIDRREMRSFNHATNPRSANSLARASNGVDQTPLRHATPDDIPSIVALEREVPGLVHWSEQRYQAVFQPGAPDRVLWVVEDEGAICRLSCCAIQCRRM